MHCKRRFTVIHNFLQDVDPNDQKLMVLLEGMAVKENGKMYKVTFVH